MIELTKVLDDVGNTASITEKKKLIEGLSPESKFLLMMANSPYITYGIKEKMMPNIFSHINKHHDDDDEFLGPFLELLDKLAKRELSGNEAVGEIGRVLCRYSRETSITFEKIILKDLRCNLGKRVINKVFPGLIPEFKCMLADKMSDKFNWNSGPWMVEYKYDGMRILAKVDTNGVTYYSRNGMEQENFEGLFDEDLYDIAQQFVNKRAVEDGGSFPIWFDGEVMASTYQKTMEANSSKGEKKELIFVTFDMLTHIEWASQTTKRNQKERRVDLEKAYDGSIETPKKVFTSNLIITDKPEEVQKFYDGLVEQGAEGVIIKDMKAPYHWKRNRAWTKYKPRYTADLEIVGFFEGKGKYEDSLGGFRLKGELEDGTLVECECGSGFNDSQRNDYWLNRDVLLNEIAEVMYQEVTANKKGDTASLRFPIFKHFRKDK